jgi:hypothetical protein
MSYNNKSLIIYIISLIVMSICMISIAFDYDNIELYCYGFTISSVVGVIHLLRYEKQKRV